MNCHKMNKNHINNINEDQDNVKGVYSSSQDSYPFALLNIQSNIF